MLSTLKPLMGAAGAGFAVAAIQMAMVVLAARTLDIALYGVFALALGLANLLAEIGTAGLPVLANRILARYGARGHGARIAQFIAHGDGVVIRVTAIGLVLLGAGALLLAPDAPVAAQALVVTAILLPGVMFRLLRRHQLAGLGHPALAAVVETGLAATAGIAALLAGGGLMELALAYGAGSLAGAALAGRVTGRWRGVSRAKPRVDDRLRAVWWRAALPMWLAAGGTALFGRIDLVMIGPLAGTTEAGLYAAAIRLTYLIGIFAQIGLPIFWPLIAREAGTSRRVHATDLRYVAITGGIGGLAAIALWTAAPQVVTLVFGASYGAAAPILRILCAAQLSALFVTALTGSMLMRGQGRAYAPVMAGGLALGVALNLALIPPMGAIGAAWATLATSLAMLIALLVRGASVIGPARKDAP